MAKLLSLLSCCLMLLACQSSPVVSDYDTSVDFSQYRYYQWDKTSKSSDALMDDRLQKAVSHNLILTMLEEASLKNPAQIIIRPSLQAKQRTQEPSSHGSIGLGGGGGGTLFGVSLSAPLSSETIVKDINIVIAILDVKTKKTLWQGNYSFTVEADEPEEISQRVEEAVHEILSQYPPQETP